MFKILCSSKPAAYAYTDPLLIRLAYTDPLLIRTPCCAVVAVCMQRYPFGQASSITTTGMLHLVFPIRPLLQAVEL